MKRFFIISLLSIIGFQVQSQQSKHLIPWSENKLTWDDYKARPNRASSFEALTAAGIGFDVNFDGELLLINVLNTFDPKNSWTKEKKSNELLRHEQLHFDISELFARKLRKELLERNYKSTGDKLMGVLTKIYKKHINALNDYQNAYDKETKHSLRKEEQLKWENKVALELKEFKDYTETELSIFP